MEPSSGTYAHDAPPMRASMSGLAITAFILSILFVCGAFVGVWWMQLIPLLLSVIAWPAIASGRRRGGGFAIAASAIALLSGIGLYLNMKKAMDGASELTSDILNSLEQGKDAKLREAVLVGEDADATIGRWKERYAKVREEYGAFTGTTTFRWGIWGPIIEMFKGPGDVEEVGGGGGKESVGAVAWFQASFDKATLWVGAEIFKESKMDQDSMKEMQRDMERGHAPIVRDLRFYKAK